MMLIFDKGSADCKPAAGSFPIPTPLQPGEARDARATSKKNRSEENLSPALAVEHGVEVTDG